MSTSPPRFKLVASVGQRGVRRSDMEGWALFGDVFGCTPAQDRYAIVETADGSFEAWDFDGFLAYHGVRSTLGHKKMPDGVIRWTGDDLDALIMKVIALYGK